MAREVVWTDPAWTDLESAADYIARDSVAYAAAFVQEVKAAAASLSEFAEPGQVVPEFGDQATRELLVNSSAWARVNPGADCLLITLSNFTQ